MMTREFREVSRYVSFRERLAVQFPDADEDTLRDTLEGLSNLPEMIAAVVRSELEDKALAKGLRGRIAEMEERLGRFEDRAGKKRELALEAMESADIHRIAEPDFTVSLRSVQPPLVIVEEKEIPEEFWRPQPAKLDRQKLRLALGSPKGVPGAVFGNAGRTISVRTKGWPFQRFKTKPSGRSSALNTSVPGSSTAGPCPTSRGGIRLRRPTVSSASRLGIGRLLN